MTVTEKNVSTVLIVEKAGFNGALKLYVGKDCQTNVTTGRICDYRYMQTVTGWQSGRSYSVDLKEKIKIYLIPLTDKKYFSKINGKISKNI